MSQEARQWYVVYSKAHREEYAQYHLQRKGIEVFFPRLRLPFSSAKRDPQKFLISVSSASTSGPRMNC